MMIIQKIFLTAKKLFHSLKSHSVGNHNDRYIFRDIKRNYHQNDPHLELSW